MTNLADQANRIQTILQDTDDSVSNLALIYEQHRESITRLSRLNFFANIQWINAIQGQAVYLLPNPTCDIQHVFYNERVLRYVTEITLDRRMKSWESLVAEPRYWTSDHQAPNTIRIIPAPSRTGDGAPVFPSPLIMPMPDNLVVFLTEDLAGAVSDPTDTLPTLLDWDDWLVFDATEGMAFRETGVQNLPVAQLCQQMKGLLMEYLKKGG